MDIKEMQTKAWEHAENMGFHALHNHLPPEEYKNIFGWRSIALIAHEVGELADGFRLDDMDNVGEELADILLRCGDLAGILGIDLEKSVISKIEKNKTRGKLHGKKIVR
jgi:NTP pyrophosphatase (non-canonical NTP hydrolase)